MGRVTIKIDAISGKKATAADTINEAFARLSDPRDAAHASKRAIADVVAAGGAPTAEFVAEAALRGITPADLAAMILSKPDAVAQRELARQTIMLKIDAATTLDELQAILSQGI